MLIWDTTVIMPYYNSMHCTVGDQLGRVVLGGGCLFGIGSLCYYGLGLSGEAGAIDRAG